MIEIDTNFWINRVIVRRGYNTNTISWKEAFYNLNDSISKNESVSAVGYTRRFVIGKNIEDAIRKNAGFFVLNAVSGPPGLWIFCTLGNSDF